MKKTELPPHTLTRTPRIAESAFIADGAKVIGDVEMKSHSSVWYNAVLRGDINYISIGERSNIQDGCIVHLENEKPCIVGNDVTVGHGAILHGCILEDGCLIGMGATILSGATIGKGSIIAAGAVVRENAEVPPFTLMAGVPAKALRTLDNSSYETNLKWAEKYTKLAKLHREKGHAAEQR